MAARKWDRGFGAVTVGWHDNRRAAGGDHFVVVVGAVTSCEGVAAHADIAGLAGGGSRGLGDGQDPKPATASAVSGLIAVSWT